MLVRGDGAASAQQLLSKAEGFRLSFIIKIYAYYSINRTKILLGCSRNWPSSAKFRNFKVTKIYRLNSKIVKCPFKCVIQRA